ncbi:MAG TPA: ShlB/FhaC/HecB family hemolysin secretion/activation protein [Gammaproteobacteria bacterium]|nr:ShlB/FhaC/HecB family hemolysin secretion/activation protein [Gammaproteobacteria bacterium]
MSLLLGFPLLVYTESICAESAISDAGSSENAVKKPDVHSDTVSTKSSDQDKRDRRSTATKTKTAAPVMNIQEYRVRGNTLLEQTRLERIVYPFLGPNKTIKDIEQARAALEAEYRNAGYPTVLVDIPEQKVVDGVVRLRVTEGRVERLRITGSHYFLLSRIRKEVPALRRGSVPHLPDVKKEMAILNQESPDRSITPIMRPGREPGTMEVELKVKDKLPLHGSLEVNGRNTESTTRTRAVGTLRYDNLWQRFHSLSLQYQTSPEKTDEVKVVAATYVFPLQDSGIRVALYGVRSDSNTDIASAGALNVVGIGDIFGGRVIMPLQGNRNYFHSLTYGVDYKSFKEGLNLVGADTLNTPIAYYPFSLRYDLTRRSLRVITSYGIGTTFGLRGLNDQVEFNNKRIFSKANFIYLSGDIQRRFPIKAGFRGKLKVSFQYTDSPLISNEQFTAGGAESVRGYYESQALGDNALQASFELHTPYLGTKSWKSMKDFYGLWFVDAAKLWVLEALPDQARGYELFSSGLGMRLKSGHMNIAMDAGYPFKAVSTVKKGDVRVHFRLAYEF